MGVPHNTVIQRYIEAKTTHLKGSSIYFEGDTLYSNFLGELAIRGNWGSGIEYIINGDRYAFVNHNWLAIANLRAVDRNNIVQIPFSALAGAGIVRETSGNRFRNGNYSDGLDRSIRIVEARDDRWWDKCVICGQAVIRQPYGLPIAPSERGDRDRDHWDYFYVRSHPWGRNSLRVERDGCYRFKYIHAHDKSDICTNTEHRLGKVKQEHELGAVVLRHGRNYYLSSIDYDEIVRRNYFLCRLPKKVNSIAEAYEALLPTQVAYAKALGRTVIRQGDIFAIKTDMKTRDLTRPTKKWERLHGTTHVARDVRYHLGKTYARGSLLHRPYLSDPTRTRPDHASQNMREDWWEVYKNTARGSWQVAGKVD